MPLSSLQVVSNISLSLSIKDFRASPYCFFNFSASSSEMFNTKAISLVILSPPSGMVLVYTKLEPSNTPISVFPAPISNNITLSFSSLVSSTKLLCARVTGTNPSISKSTFLKIEAICLIYSLPAKITCAFNVKLPLKFPIGSVTTFPFSRINWFSTISIICLPSGTSISFTCIMLEVTSFAEIPAYLSLASFNTLFCTIVTYFPGIVT